MHGTEFEFRNRFWLISSVIWARYACYFLDHRNGAVAVASALAGENRVAVQLVLGAGALLIFVGAALRTWASAYLRSKIVKDAALHTDLLVADGPYRYVRHPLYLGTFLLAVGLAPTASQLGSIVMVLGIMILLVRLIGREEAALALAQGARYDAYRAAVPSLWPALWPQVPAGDARPQWRQAVVGELMMWAFALGAGLFAATFDLRIFLGFVVLGLIGYMPGVWARARR